MVRTDMESRLTDGGRGFAADDDDGDDGDDGDG